MVKPYNDLERRCPFCGEIPWTYEGKRSKEINVYCNNKSYKGQPGIECPLAGRPFSVQEWNYRPHEDMLLERFLRAKKLLQDAIKGNRDNWHDWLDEISEEFS